MKPIQYSTKLSSNYPLNKTFIFPLGFSSWTTSCREECPRLTETTAENEELLRNNFPSLPMISIHTPSSKRCLFTVGFLITTSSFSDEGSHSLH